MASSSDVDLPFKRVNTVAMVSILKTADWLTFRAVSSSPPYISPSDLFSCLEERVGEALTEMVVPVELFSHATV